MKKILFIITFLIISFFTLSTEASADGNVYIVKGLGYSVNLVKGNGEKGYNPAMPIIDGEYLKTISVVQSSGYSRINKTASRDIVKISNDINSFYSDSIDVGGIYKGVTFNPALKFNLAGGSNVAESTYQYYESLSSIICRRTLTLENSADVMYSYGNHLSGLYLDALQKLKNGEITYERFFDVYGTHILTSADFGGAVNAFYSFNYGERLLNDAMISELSKSCSVSMNNLINASESTELDLSGAISIEKNYLSYNYSFYTIGGASNYIGDSNNFDNKYNSWVKSLNDDTEAIVAYSSNGVTPLWEVLPEEYKSLKTTMESEYFNYNRTYSNAIYDNYFTNTTKTEKINVNSGEYTVTDRGRFKNHAVKVDLTNYFRLSLSEMKSRGYNKIQITIDIELKKIDRGTQYVFIYNNSNDSSSNPCLYGFDWAHQVVDYYSWYNDINATLDISQLSYTNNYFYLLFGASGSYNDDWKYRNINVMLTFIK